MDQDIRWIQRLVNYRKALGRLGEGCTMVIKSDLEKEGLIHRFEFTYELAWQTLQDLLAHRGFQNVKGPTLSLAKALQLGYLEDGAGWDAIRKGRNRSSHTYDQVSAQELFEEIRDRFQYLFFELEERLMLEKAVDEGIQE